MLSHYPPPHAVQPDLSTTSALGTVLAALRRIFYAHKNYALALVSLTSVAGIALALGYYLAQTPTTTVIASSIPALETVTPPVVDITTPALVASVPVESAPAATQIPTQGAPRSATGPVDTAVNTSPRISSEAAPATRTTLAPRRGMHKTALGEITPPVEKAPAADKKYDSLRKAWGG